MSNTDTHGGFDVDAGWARLLDWMTAQLSHTLQVPHDGPDDVADLDDLDLAGPSYWCTCSCKRCYDGFHCGSTKCRGG
jgi:hypothetical protein